jgi:hypothetical protein
LRQAGRALLGALGLVPALLWADPARADRDERAGLFLDLPVAEVPYTTSGRFPSMAQSLWLSADTYQAVHYGIERAIDGSGQGGVRGVLARVAVGAADLAVGLLPLGYAWQKSEWQRAVLGREQIGSANDAYRYHPFSQISGVSQVSDGDLADLKARRPATFVRLSTAAMEGSYELATATEKVQFFYQPRTFNAPLLWQLYLLNTFTLATCASSRSDTVTRDAESSEGTSLAKRDINGLDCTAWAHDLVNPAEPYAARGLHPSGVGVRRYLGHGDLTATEQGQVKRALFLSLLNFADPALAGFDGFSIGHSGTRMNSHIRYTPAPFGSSVDLDVFAQITSFNIFVSLHSYLNHSSYFPGLSAELHRFPLDLVIGLPFSVSARAGLWLQPQDQAFETSSGALGALGALRVGYSFTRELEPYVEIERKSTGWVAGNAWLESVTTARLGLVATLFQ